MQYAVRSGGRICATSFLTMCVVVIYAFSRVSDDLSGADME